MNIQIFPDFGGDKAPEAFRTIGEVAKTLGIRQHVLRYWEEQFPTLRPLTRAGGRRYYRPDDVALIVEIDRLLNQQGYTIKGAKQALRGPKANIAATQDAVPTQQDALQKSKSALPFSAASLQDIRDRLAAAIAD